MNSGDHQSPNRLFTAIPLTVSAGGGRRDLSRPIVLTDSPRIAALKREFRQLDQREEEIKFAVRADGFMSRTDEAELQDIRTMKAAIATEIFRPE